MSLDTLKSDILTLRAPEEADVDRLFFWENDRSLMECVATAAPLSRFQVWEYVHNYTADPYASGELRLILVKPDGVAVGYIDLYSFDAVNRRAGVGIYIDEEFRGMGIGKEALRLLCDYVQITLGIHQLWATVAIDNKSSVALFNSAGFKSTGKLRSWIRRGGQYADALILQLLFA